VVKFLLAVLVLDRPRLRLQLGCDLLSFSIPLFLLPSNRSRRCLTSVACSLKLSTVDFG